MKKQLLFIAVVVAIICSAFSTQRKYSFSEKELIYIFNHLERERRLLKESEIEPDQKNLFLREIDTLQVSIIVKYGDLSKRKR